ncbi:MAG: YcxB family protein [Ruminococcaceae bacterium]|nr:YcxB family protein [Oscillospiraceae bacterium]
MEVIFKNNTTLNESYVKQVTRATVFRRPAVISLYVISALLLIISTCRLAINGKFFRFGFLFPVGIIVALFFLYFSTVKLNIRRLREVYGNSWKIVTEVTDEGICQIPDGKTAVNLTFQDVLCAVTSKDYIFVISKGKIVYAFSKNGFSIGDDASFLTFLKSKGIKVK